MRDVFRVVGIAHEPQREIVHGRQMPLHERRKRAFVAGEILGDEFFINGGFDSGCESVRLGGKTLAKLQSGRVQNYFRVLSLGAAILLLVYFFT